MIAVIDNYDSFTYNLVQYLGELGTAVQVFRNDAIEPEHLVDGAYTGILISPGPCTPLEAGISNAVIRMAAGKLPVLGVCLGHQCIGHTFGGVVERAAHLMHGKASEIWHNGTGLYAGVPSPFTAARYHSLVVSRQDLPACLEITAQTAAGDIMGLRHKRFDIEGVQFHPESILTSHGRRIIANFLRRTNELHTQIAG